MVIEFFLYKAVLFVAIDMKKNNELIFVGFLEVSLVALAAI